MPGAEDDAIEAVSAYLAKLGSPHPGSQGHSAQAAHASAPGSTGPSAGRHPAVRWTDPGNRPFDEHLTWIGPGDDPQSVEVLLDAFPRASKSKRI